MPENSRLCQLFSGIAFSPFLFVDDATAGSGTLGAPVLESEFLAGQKNSSFSDQNGSENGLKVKLA